MYHILTVFTSLHDRRPRVITVLCVVVFTRHAQFILHERLQFPHGHLEGGVVFRWTRGKRGKVIDVVVVADAAL